MRTPQPTRWRTSTILTMAKGKSRCVHGTQLAYNTTVQHLHTVQHDDLSLCYCVPATASLHSTARHTRVNAP